MLVLPPQEDREHHPSDGSVSALDRSFRRFFRRPLRRLERVQRGPGRRIRLENERAKRRYRHRYGERTTMRRHGFGAHPAEIADVAAPVGIAIAVEDLQVLAIAGHADAPPLPHHGREVEETDDEVV